MQGIIFKKIIDTRTSKAKIIDTYKFKKSPSHFHHFSNVPALN